jgi:histidinol dehydrogenase
LIRLVISQVQETAKSIVNQIKQRGDEALIEFTTKFDNLNKRSVADMEISKSRLMEALDNIPKEIKEDLKQAAERIRNYHNSTKGRIMEL